MKIINGFEKYLTIWTGLAMILGIAIGKYFSPIFTVINKFEYENINLIIALLAWILIYPMMLNLNFSNIIYGTKNKKGFYLTLIVNWILTPIVTIVSCTLFFKYFYKNIFSIELAEQYMTGVILLSITPCSATIIIWSRLTKGNVNYTLTQIILNIFLIIPLFSPLAKFLLKTTHINVPYSTLFFSTFVYLIIPLIFAIITKKYFNKRIEQINNKLKYLSPSVLLMMIFLLFSFQADMIINNPLTIFLIAIPIILQTYILFFTTYFIGYKIKLPHDITSPASLIGASNFFELSIAVTITLFGLDSPASTAAMVGVLTEVPIMLSLVKFSNKTRKYFINKNEDN